MALDPQAALEQACSDAIISAAPPAGLSSYTTRSVGRTFDGQPPPLCGNYYVAIWSDNMRQSQSRTSLDELFHVFITLTMRCHLPYDRWIEHRDEMERRVNGIRALIHKDSLDFHVTRAANTLAGFTWSAVDTIKRVGWTEALAFDGLDPIQAVGPPWFHAHTDSTKVEVGIAQRSRFGKSRRIQSLATMA